MVDMEFEPTGLVEKLASGLRFVSRAVEADLARFKAYVEMEDAKGIDYESGREAEQSGERDAGEDEEKRRERQQRREQRRDSSTS